MRAGLLGGSPRTLHSVAAGRPGSGTGIFRRRPTSTSGQRDSDSWHLPQLGLLGLLTLPSPPWDLSSTVASEAPAAKDAGRGLQRHVSQEGETDGRCPSLSNSASEATQMSLYHVQGNRSSGTFKKREILFSSLGWGNRKFVQEHAKLKRLW